MIAFFGRIGVLDPDPVGESTVREAIGVRWSDDARLGALVDLLARGAGAEVPFVFSRWPVEGRSFGDIARPHETANRRSHFREELFLVAEGGGGDQLWGSPEGEIFAEISARPGVKRSLNLLAPDLDSLFAGLTLDYGLLTDMAAFANEDGLPHRTTEVEQLRRHFVEFEQ